MIKPLHKIAAALAGALVMLAGAVPASAGPVKPLATLNGCDPNNICLYDWTNNNYSSGFWQRTYVQIQNSNDGAPDCVNLSNHQWHDLAGSPNNTASSLTINWSSGPTRKITFYDSSNCGAQGGYSYGYYATGNTTVIETNLANTNRPACNFGACSLNWYDRISSVKVENWN